jgi:hypothetical protein
MEVLRNVEPVLWGFLSLSFNHRFGIFEGWIPYDRSAVISICACSSFGRCSFHLRSMKFHKLEQKFTLSFKTIQNYRSARRLHWKCTSGYLVFNYWKLRTPRRRSSWSVTESTLLKFVTRVNIKGDHRNVTRYMSYIWRYEIWILRWKKGWILIRRKYIEVVSLRSALTLDLRSCTIVQPPAPESSWIMLCSCQYAQSSTSIYHLFCCLFLQGSFLNLTTNGKCWTRVSNGVPWDGIWIPIWDIPRGPVPSQIGPVY